MPAREKILQHSWHHMARASAVAWLAFAISLPAADVQVVKKGAGKSPIDLTGLSARGGEAASKVAGTLENDLRLSGWFTIAGAGRGSIAVSGACVEAGKSVSLSCRVVNKGDRGTYLSWQRTVPSADASRLAHELADEIVRAVRGVAGIASTRIAMVGLRGGSKDVYVCDSDGGNLRKITSDGVPCLGPAWGPRGSFLTYTSFRGGFPDVYKIDMQSLTRSKVAGFPGLNSGADVAPDGLRMVLTLSKDGNPDLYIVDFRSGPPKRITRTRFAAEASPSWAPDGKQIVFVSDRAGLPQLYILSTRGGRHARLTYQGRENVAPDWGPDGRIAYSSKRGGGYHICVMNPMSREDVQLTRGVGDYEDPSWAPDGRHIVCTKTSDYHSDLYILDTMGDPPIRLTRISGDWYSPSWSGR
ncbi:MAG: PD40 domain-containing protein [Lentisphaerae bacterium]|nr:PD40 domain-containing protein [Lentisphaerota bacterium]